MKRSSMLGAAAIGFFLSVGAAAQTGYPTKPVRLIATSAPGASIDITARLAANWLQTRLGQPFVVENRPGAQGVIATEAVAKSPPDGYTLLVHSHTVPTQVLLVKNVPYDWTRDLTPIVIMAGGGYALITATTIPPRTLSEFVDYAKANPGKLNHAAPGGFAPEMEEMKSTLGLPMERISYKGGAPATAAVAAGEAHLMFGAVFQGLPLAKAGKARVIAYSGATRHPSMPDVPTLSESGYPGYTTGFWLGISGPGGLPASLAGLLNREIREMNKAPETIERYRAQGYEPYELDPEGMRREMLDYAKRSAAVVQRLGIKPE
jgi:tripartite-type tricarboxylate transporter receptor subunit TctC